MVFEGQRQNGRKGQVTQETRLEAIVGGMPVYEDGALYSNPQPPPPPAYESWSLNQLILDHLDSLFAVNAAAGMGPTASARNYYLFLASITQAYEWVTKGGFSDGKDGWNYGERYILPSDTDVFCWMNHALCQILPSFNVTVDSTQMFAKERAYLQWNVETQALALQRIQLEGKWSLWFSTWEAWFAGRAADGSQEASVAPATSEMPNGSISLDVTTTQNIASYPQPYKWTPLIVGGRQRKYLTYTWDSVRSTCLTAEEEAAMNTAAAAAFPSDTERTTEVASLLTMTQTLTDEQKCIAELWAGGPGTVSPPGMYMMLWRLTCEALKVNTSTLLQSGMQLAVSLFEGSRLTWALKKQFMQARPIQEIRLRYKNDNVVLYNGTTVKGELWVPFQASNFVTPPFADFPSGHSCFGRCFANVMTHWFGPTVPSTTVTLTGAKRFSPLLPSTLTTSFGSFPIASGASEAQPAVVPASPLTLNFTTWDAMAESSGISRQFGGIHCMSAHTGSVTLADDVTAAVITKWN